MPLGWPAGVLALAGVFAQSPAAASSDLVTVSVDKARIARIPDKTQTLVIGQPGIADVTMLKNSGMGVITGKSFGETNLIALDAQGNLLGEWIVRVGAENRISWCRTAWIARAISVRRFACPPCELSDAKGIAADRAAAASQHTAYSAGH